MMHGVLYAGLFSRLTRPMRRSYMEQRVTNACQRLTTLTNYGVCPEQAPTEGQSRLPRLSSFVLDLGLFTVCTLGPPTLVPPPRGPHLTRSLRLLSPTKAQPTPLLAWIWHSRQRDFSIGPTL